MPEPGDPADAAAGARSTGEPTAAGALGRALEQVGQRWALLIVGELLDGSRRFGDLQRALGVPTNILATRLRELQAYGLVYREPMAHNVLAYSLTRRGRELAPVIAALERWAEGRAK